MNKLILLTILAIFDIINISSQSFEIDNFLFENVTYRENDHQLEKLFIDFFHSKSILESSKLFHNNSMPPTSEKDFNSWRKFIDKSKVEFNGAYCFNIKSDTFAIIKYKAYLDDLISNRYLRVKIHNKKAYTIPLFKDPKFERTIYNFSLIKPSQLEYLIKKKSIFIEETNTSFDLLDPNVYYASSKKVDLQKSEFLLINYLNKLDIDKHKQGSLISSFRINDMDYLVQSISSQTTNLSYSTVLKDLNLLLGYNIFIHLLPENISNEK